MRLAVFTSVYPARTATFFERDMRSLIEAGVEIEVFAISPPPKGSSAWDLSLDLLGPKHLPRDRVHHLSIGDGLSGSAAALRRSPFAAARDAARVLRAAARYGPVRFAKTAYLLPKAWTWAARAAATSKRFDHVLAYWGNYAGTCAYLFHRLATPNIPFSIWLHAGTDLYRGPVFMREKLRYADNVITCCEFNQGYIRDQFGDVPDLERKVYVSHHGLNLSDFPPRLDGRATNRLLAVGRLTRRKGFDYLVHAAKLLHDRGERVVIEFVGDGDERTALEALAAELGIAGHVEFRGWLPFERVRETMANATLLIHPSDGLGDGLPNVIREAMALGTPVVASNVAGIPDALKDGCGMLVPPKDPEALALAVTLLLHDPAERRAMALRGRRRAEEEYDLWRNGARLAELLRHRTPRIAA
jgi:glycosyltransferase involved in cell wall biosynthesis